MKIFEGLVVSKDKNNTAVVEITRRTPHPLYKKLIRLSKKLKADTTGFEIEIGNKVKIVETRPISKSKYFKIMEVVGQKAKLVQKDEKPKEVKEVKKSVKSKKGSPSKAIK
jgi:small subunit ribosomal protein S17